MISVLKILAYILILASTTGAGFIYGQSLKKRVNQLKEMEITLYNIKNQIEFTNTSLPEAMKIACENGKEPVKSIFIGASELLFNNSVEDVFQAFDISIKKNSEKTCFTREDIKILRDFSKSVGNMDISGEKSIFSLILGKTKIQIEGAENIVRKNLKMYRYLGFSIGAMIDIMII